MNEFAYKLQAIQANNKVSLRQIAAKEGCSYSYLRNQKVSKKPSHALTQRLERAFGRAATKNITTEEPDSATTSPKPCNLTTYYHGLLTEKEARRRAFEEQALRAEAFSSRLLTIIENLTIK